MYFNDSVAMKVYAYDFDLESGNISNRRLFIDRRSTYGEPDGMVVEYVRNSDLCPNTNEAQHTREPVDSSLCELQGKSPSQRRVVS